MSQSELPAGDYAIVELFGHVTLVGRVAEVERFGTKMLAIEALFGGTLLPAVYYGGGAVYGVTPCAAETAFARQPTKTWQLPASLRCVLPAPALAAPSASEDDAKGDDEDGGDEEGGEDDDDPADEFWQAP